MRYLSLIRSLGFKSLPGALILALVMHASAVASVSQRENCDALEDESTNSVSQCLYRNLKKAEAELRLAEKTVNSGEPASTQKKLKLAQAAWKSGRDADCEFQIDIERGGSIQKILFPACLIKATDQRTLDLLNSEYEPDDECTEELPPAEMLACRKEKVRVAVLSLEEKTNALKQLLPDDEALGLLGSSEGAWVEFRDLEVNFEKAFYEDSSKVFEYMVLEELVNTRQRLVSKWLEDYR